MLGIKLEYIQKHTSADNGNIESFHNSIKTYYLWPNEISDFREASSMIEEAFTDYNTVRPHSSIDYLAPDVFERKLCEEEGFRDKFLEDRKRRGKEC